MTGTQLQPTILFIDDEQYVLNSLRRLLLQENWQKMFVLGGQEALEILAEQQIDLVVSDIRMPGLDGIEFLREVKNKYPKTIRIVLSGNAEREIAQQLLAEGSAQQIIAKPWDDDDLKETIRMALYQAGKQKKENSGLQIIINSLNSLPPLPQIYQEIMETISGAEDLPIDRISEVVQQDPAMTTQLLHWANSALFGYLRKVESVNRAIVILGVDMLKGLILSHAAFDVLATDISEKEEFNREAFRLHSYGCGVAARLLIMNKGADRQQADLAFTAGLLHDLGKIILDFHLHDQFEQIIDTAMLQEELLVHIEPEIINTSHAEIGSQLAEWWNMPPFLSDTIRFHHTPEKNQDHFEITAAVHVANFLAQRYSIGASGNFCLPKVSKHCLDYFNLNEKQMEIYHMKISQAIRVLV